MVDLKKVFTHSRMPANTRISDVIAFAESIGCAVEFRLVQRESSPTTVAVDLAKPGADKSVEIKIEDGQIVDEREIPPSH